MQEGPPLARGPALSLDKNRTRGKVTAYKKLQFKFGVLSFAKIILTFKRREMTKSTDINTEQAHIFLYIFYDYANIKQRKNLRD